ncbi:unnamed protein product [Dibothriocephalus latus]|uniref:DEP domain-containing protein n=1 Tax=Dibothriocephalus latus TaxID=60516 RepID=A0A3P7LS08_DIBLA|nr:unnamed protein product [Dibothriocephalus latus]
MSDDNQEIRRSKWQWKAPQNLADFFRGDLPSSSEPEYSADGSSGDITLPIVRSTAVSGDNLIGWIEHFLGVEDIQEAAHIANVLLLYGYIYPLTDYKSSIVKDDPTAFYRFQAPYYWISKIPKPDAMDYAIYLVKRTLRKRQKYGLEEYEQSALHRLQNMLGHKWEFICIQAANQVRLYKERRKSDKIVLEAQVGVNRVKFDVPVEERVVRVNGF